MCGPEWSVCSVWHSLMLWGQVVGGSGLGELCQVRLEERVAGGVFRVGIAVYAGRFGEAAVFEPDQQYFGVGFNGQSPPNCEVTELMPSPSDRLRMAVAQKQLRRY